MVDDESSEEWPENEETYLDYLEKLVDYLSEADLWLNETDDHNLKQYFYEATKYAYFANQNNRAGEKEKEKEAAQAVLKFYPSPEINSLN